MAVQGDLNAIVGKDAQADWGDVCRLYGNVETNKIDLRLYCNAETNKIDSQIAN